MGETEERMHFGLNCRHLRRDEYPPADWRCASAIERYAGPEYAFLNTKTAVPLKVAERLLGLPQPELVKRAKAGQFEWFFPENVAKRVTIFTKMGERQVTISVAAKRLHKSVAELEKQVATGEIKAEHPDEFMHIVLTTRWDYEKCPLIESGGICYYFQAHDGPQIRCLADAPRVTEKAT